MAKARSLEHFSELEKEYTKNVAYLHKNADSETETMDKFVSSLSRQFAREWSVRSKLALKAAMSAYTGKHSVGQVAKVMAAIQSEIEEFPSRNMADIDSQIQDIYEGIVGGFLQLNDLLVQKAVGKPTSAGITLLMTKKDEDAIAAIQKLTTQTAGVNFPEEVLGKAALVVKEVVLDRGLPPADAARRLENEIAGVLGIADAAVPSTFETNPEAYFEILANNAALMARNVGGLIAMENAQIQKYRISAILDKRTSAICRALDGRVFSVSAGMEMVNTVIGLDSAQELKETFPWSKWQSGKVGPDTLANNDKIAREGLGFPPYHGSCRSLVLPEF